MIDRLHEFFGLLRRNGVPLSPAETLDGLRAVDEVGVGDPERLQAALGATLVKRPAHQEIFDELFELFFRRRGDSHWRDSDAPLLETLREKGFTEEEVEALLALLADQAAQMSAVARMGLGLRRGPVEALLRLSGVRLEVERLHSPLQIGFYTQQLARDLKLREAESEATKIRDALSSKIGAERAAALGEVLSLHLNELRQALRRYVAAEFERANVKFLDRFRAENLSDKPFAAMSEDELRRLTDEVARLGRKLKQQLSLRPRLGRLGRLDVRRTVRRSLASGGVPFVLVRKRKRIDKPRLVVLCDISDSVRNVSRFMLQFAYVLQDEFQAVRSFVFVADVAEVTSLFREHELGAAIEMAYRGAAVNVYANSNYGRALVEFRKRFLDGVTPKTTVIVIGDGRNNYNPVEDWALADVRARARRVVWLNPEPPASWAFGDSAMQAYAQHCDRVAVVHNLTSLKEVVEQLVL